MNCDTLDITGGVKFFKANKALYKDGNSASATSNDTSAKYALASNKYVRWESLNSNDITTETFTVNFKNSVTIDRILLKGINLKSFNIKYDASLDFANVSGLDGDLVGGISETAFEDETAYYKFDAVTVDSIIITMNTTQTVDAEKVINEVIATQEIGTLQGFPRVSNVQHNRNIRKSKALSGLSVIQKSYEATSFRLRFKTYPVAADIALADTLHDSEEPALVWLCGGKRGVEYFPVPQRGWGISDIYNMHVSRPLSANYAKGIYNSGADTTLSFIEVV